MGRKAVTSVIVLLAASMAAPVTAQERPSWGESFGWESLGGTVGSGLGLSTWLLLDEDACGDDLGCSFEKLYAMGAVASALSTTGAVVVGRAKDTEPSILGAALGSLAGALAAAGTYKVYDEARSDRSRDPGVEAAVLMAVSQGIVTALGSRLVAALR